MVVILLAGLQGSPLLSESHATLSGEAAGATNESALSDENLNTLAEQYTTNIPPVASFIQSATTVEAGVPVSFDASSSFDPDGVVVSYTWDFGDGTVATVTEPRISHTYSPQCPASFTVTLRVTDNSGAISSPATSTITVAVVILPYTMKLTPGIFQANVGEVVTFTATVNPCSHPTPIDYLWDFGDGTTASTLGSSSSTDVQSHVYTVPGPVTVRLTVVDSKGIESLEAFGLIKGVIIEVSIDVKPGSAPNSINVKSQGVIPVAILTTQLFDAATVDPSTVRFGRTGTEAAPVKSSLEDVDGDGDLDVVLLFNVQDAGFKAGDTQGTLTGKTFDGIEIEGVDTVRAFFPGDVDADLDVDIIDASLLAYAFESTPGSALWNPYADFDENNIINILDAAELGYRFGQHA